MRMGLMIWAMFWAFLIDQISKYMVVHWMDLARVRAIDVLPPFLNLRYGENRGINFGLFNGDADWVRWILIGFSLLVVATVYYWVHRWHPSRRMQLAAGLLMGGALGNVIDRLVYGYVLDFLNMSCCGIDNPFVFNIADVFIFVGAIGLILFDSSSRSGKKAA